MSSTSRKFIHSHSLNFYPPPNVPTKIIFKLYPNKNFIFSCSLWCCTILILISSSLHTQVMLILILTVAQYLHFVFSFEKCTNGQNTTPHRLPPPNRKSPRSLPLETILKTLPCHAMFALINKTIFHLFEVNQMSTRNF